MSTAAHSLSGAAIGKIIANAYPDITPFNEIWIIILAVLLSNLPDINMLWHRKFTTHHDDVTHYPINALIFTFIVFVVEFLTLDNSFVLTFLTIACLTMHYLLDTFGNTIGVHWLWPFSNKEFSFTNLAKDKIDMPLMDRVMTYFRKAGWAELSIWAVSLFVIFFL